MKSTIRISVVPMGANGEGEPVIKIVQPMDIIDFYDYENTGDEDVRDDLLKTFLQSRSCTSPNNWFEVKTTNPIPFGSSNPSHRITTIGPINYGNLFYRFRHAVLNELVPDDTIIELNGIGLQDNAKDLFKDIRNGKRPMPQRGDIYFKIHEFFDWVDEEKTSWWNERQEAQVTLA